MAWRHLLYQGIARNGSATVIYVTFVGRRTYRRPAELPDDIVRILHNLCAVPQQSVAARVPATQYISRDDHDIPALLQRARSRDERPRFL